ncbi:MAG: TonB-dependent receptor plug domain-containing protein [Candidatus Zixiibacteriota bacterium]
MGVIALICVVLPIQATAADIQGRITSADSNLPLEQVNIVVLGTDFSAVTDESGVYALEDMPPGRYQIRFSRIGRVTLLRWIEIPQAPDSAFIVALDQALEEDLIIAPGVSVVAERVAAGGRVDGAMTVIGSNEALDQRALGAEELLRRAPGVTVAGDDGTSNRLNVGIRGLYPRRASRILILEDGAPIQPSPYLAPAAYYSPPGERIDIIEVVKGSSALSYGPHTMGGVINYITKQPPPTQRVGLSLVGGANEYASSYLKFGGTYDGVGVDLQLLYKSFGGFRENTGYDLYSGVAKLVWARSSRSILGAKLNVHAEDAQATYSALTQYEFATAPKTNRFKHDFLDTDRLALDVTHYYQLSANTSLRSLGFFSGFTRDWWRENSKTVAATTEFPGAVPGDLIRVGAGDNRARLREFRVVGLQSDINHHYQALGRIDCSSAPAWRSTSSGTASLTAIRLTRAGERMSGMNTIAHWRLRLSCETRFSSAGA